MWIHHVDRPALVLGSSQPEHVVDRARATAEGVDVVRRRSGGGAVLLEPGASAWIDLVLPAADPLWDDDVVRAASWVGEAFRAALADLGVEAQVHAGRLVTGRWGELVCFAGRGPGEVLVGPRKVVGLSQRRTRLAARFQCLVIPSWDPGRLLSLLALSEADHEAARADLAMPTARAAELPIAAVEAAVLDHLPA